MYLEQYSIRLRFLLRVYCRSLLLEQALPALGITSLASIYFKSIIMILACFVLICRCVYKKKSGVWQEAYHNVMKKVQDMMLVVYGAKLKLQDTFT